jgi:hypothetical protein
VFSGIREPALAQELPKAQSFFRGSVSGSARHLPASRPISPTHLLGLTH